MDHGEVRAFLSSELGARSLKAPQDDEAGQKAIALMKGNKESSVDMIEMAEKVYKLPLAGTTVIELGPGAGYGTKAIVSKQPASIIAFEISPVFRKMLSTDHALAPSIASGMLIIRQEDAVAMPSVATSSVDVIFGMNVVYFLHPLDVYLKEMIRVLKPGGWVIFGTKPIAQSMGAAEHFVNKDNNAVVTAMAAAGFCEAMVAPARLATDPPTPAGYIPVVGRKAKALAKL